ncbi:NADH-quinone oxidoreductase subunit J [Buchnera aphidicola]|uniref:NADH-quinone oxidoreductase subunit J n=1 Tax=Buchnera aphidicola (Aphis gossypii) TaxID=98785 RepID=A0A5J6ZBK4_9GAMM|nr:NADH-quinone oxidoreductase subunit J [Buchnera aphidicola]QFQ32007.1 NADH-quinone oxidoreductase subunit J [Buchnera aphidicola (Aphis gossypii)]UPT14536.1 NADH-quinone oxidoreductase subunit J [Buchnera aphidicola (Aphis gossypii)]
MNFVFYICAFVSIISTFLVIIQKNAVYALLYLIISILSISGIFFTIGAFFAGALEVIIYAGAILVLFIFVVMMLNLGKKDDIKEKKNLHPVFWITPSFLTLILFLLMTYVIFFLKEKKIEFFLMNTKMIGVNLFGPYLLLVELASFLLLSALVVVFHIGTEKNKSKK